MGKKVKSANGRKLGARKKTAHRPCPPRERRVVAAVLMSVRLLQYFLKG